MKNSIQITKAIVHVTNSHPYSPWRTANGGHALFSNTDGYYNTATGVDVFIATPPAPTTRRAVMRR